jgi:hypothetical protein
MVVKIPPISSPKSGHSRYPILSWIGIPAEASLALINSSKMLFSIRETATEDKIGMCCWPSLEHHMLLLLIDGIFTTFRADAAGKDDRQTMG